jgi:hypothetical protein
MAYYHQLDWSSLKNPEIKYLLNSRPLKRVLKKTKKLNYQLLLCDEKLPAF